MKRYLLILTLLISFLYNKAQETGSFTDTRDSKIYKTVKIGSQTWLAENFAYKPSSGNYWYYGDDQKNISKYGYLYDLETAKKNVPTGWHIPTKEEWETLIYNINSSQQNIDTSKDNLSFEVIDPKKVYIKMIKDGKSGFNALLAGWRSGLGFTDLEKIAVFWSSGEAHPVRENVGMSATLELNSVSGRVDIWYKRPTMGLSVRLVKD